MSTFCIFSCDNDNFAIEVASVLEIIEVTRIHQIPKAPTYINGLVNHRGKIIPVFDIRVVLSIKKTGTITHVVITAYNNILLGFAAEKCPATVHSISFQNKSGDEIIKGIYNNLKLINLEKIIKEYKI
ncbi:MAG TPA: chemotaxis protein CheW [Thermodesulfovibrionia bacterium]|nr:chemotaxis protein CheW [Thermodesulfovibrionia bacterium]